MAWDVSGFDRRDAKTFVLHARPYARVEAAPDEDGGYGFAVVDFGGEPLSRVCQCEAKAWEDAALGLPGSFPPLVYGRLASSLRWVRSFRFWSRWLKTSLWYTAMTCLESDIRESSQWAEHGRMSDEARRELKSLLAEAEALWKKYRR